MKIRCINTSSPRSDGIAGNPTGIRLNQIYKVAEVLDETGQYSINNDDFKISRYSQSDDRGQYTPRVTDMQEFEQISNTRSFLPTAEEMRKKMQTHLSEKDEKQLKEIAESIKRNWANGYCYCTSPASQLVKRELSKAGYVLTESNDQRDGYSMMISWK